MTLLHLAVALAIVGGLLFLRSIWASRGLTDVRAPAMGVLFVAAALLYLHAVSASDLLLALLAAVAGGLLIGLVSMRYESVRAARRARQEQRAERRAQVSRLDRAAWDRMMAERQPDPQRVVPDPDPVEPPPPESQDPADVERRRVETVQKVWG